MDPMPRRSSLTQDTCRHLREAILSGRLTEPLPGELELSRRLRVSRVTLRSALAQLEHDGLLRVSRGRRREIVIPAGRKAAAAPGHPERVVMLSPVAFSGLTVSKLLWLEALREMLAAQNVPLEFIVSAASALKRPGRILRSLTDQHPQSVWLLLRSTAQMQRWFREQNLPAVVAGSIFENGGLPSVDTDYFSACRHAAGRLLARGCERLGLLIPQPVLAGDQESEAGFREGAGRHPVLTAHHDGSPDGLCRALDGLMKSGAPHGLLVFHATHAVTALTRLLGTGWHVPRDVKLISRDDDPILRHLSPEPARYAVAPQAFAARLAKLIHLWLDGATADPAAERLLPEFISGATLQSYEASRTITAGHRRSGLSD